MTLRRIIKTSLTGLQTNRGRAALTILGIVIGITAIIIVMAVGQSAQKLILDQIQGLGSKTIAIVPGKQPEGPSDAANVFLDSLKERDVESLNNKGNVPYADSVMPVVFGTARTGYEEETYQATVLGLGSATEDNIISKVFSIETDKGDMFSADDVRSRTSVVVIGSKVKEKLFGLSDAVGEKVKINGRNFRVVGTLPSKGQVSFFNFDEMVLAPYTTVQQYILGRKYFDRVIVVAGNEASIERTVNDIEIVLRNNHGITDPDKDDFFVETQADLLDRVSSVTTILTILLAAIAAVSLLVGGVGIMNIMFVSVTERTKEIGLRKAVGATNADIMKQFLFEAVWLTLIGGVVGVILGSGLAATATWAIAVFYNIDFSFSFPWTAAVMGIGVAAGVGLIFGIYPARQAARKSPIEALRYE